MADEKKGFFDKIKGALKDEKGTDDILDKVEDAANKVTGGKFEDKVKGARDAADKHLGSE